MALKCPKCQSDNPETAGFCADCGTQLGPSEEIEVSHTKTLETPVEELTRGTVFADRYEIIEELGKGGMGKVYRVEDKKTGEELALKLIKPEISADKRTVERFSNELRLAHKISHRNVCRMFHLGEEKGTYYITMEYVPGEDLKSFIRRSGQLAVGTTIRIARQVCDGLTEAHRLGVVHRDLKPSNIMIDKEGNARIMDFGIARSLKAKGITGAGIMVGTPEYMSPEQAEAKEVDRRSDIYSLGVILYEMVTGQRPFEGDTPLSIAMKHKGEMPKNPKDLNPQVPEDVSQLILKSMEKDKEKRCQSAEELHTELDNIEKGIPTTQREAAQKKPITSKEITVKFRLKNLLIPALVVVVAIVVGLFIWRPWSPKEAIPIPTDKPSLAILYFENNTGDSDLDRLRKGVSSLLISDLMQSQYLHVLSTDVTFEILKGLDLLDTESYSTEDLKEIALKGNVSYILHGSFDKAGDKLRFDLFVKELKSGRTLGSDNVEGNEENIFAMVDELTRKIKRHFELTEEQISEDIDQSVSQVTTASSKAYIYYDEAIEYDLKGDYLKSIEMLNMALEIDSQFALAYRRLAGIYDKFKRRELSNQYLTKAYEFSERTSKRDKYRIQFDYFYANGKQKEALESLNKLFELYPDDYEGIYYLGEQHFIDEEWDKAIEKLEINRRNRVEHVYSYGILAHAYMAKGSYNEAKEVLEDYIKTFSGNNYIYRRLANVFLCQGNYDAVLAVLDDAYLQDPLNPVTFEDFGDVYHAKGDFAKAEEAYQKLLNANNPTFQYIAYNNFPFIYLSQGKIQKAKELLIQGIERAKKQGDASREADFHSHLAYIMRQSADYEGALKECIQSSPPLRSLHHKGLIYAAMGLQNEAQTTVGEMKELIGPVDRVKSSQGYYHLMGHIELSKGNFTKAIEFFRLVTSSLPHPYVKHNNHALYINSLAIAFFRSGDIEKAEAEYRKITELTVSRLFFGDVYAKTFYMLGKICEQKDQKDKAIEHYEKFLELWKDADPGIPEVEDVKKRLKELRSR